MLDRPQTRSDRTVAGVLALAALCFVLYPCLRPYSSETGYAGARAFASDRWVLAHLIGVTGFALLGFAVGRVHPRGWVWPAAFAGVVLVLPYYGAEMFGVHQVGVRALDERDTGLVAMADDIRMGGIALTTFAIGLLLLAAVGVALAMSGARRGRARALSSLLVGLGLVTYSVQYFAPGWLRVVHGLVLALGLAGLALAESDRGTDHSTRVAVG